MTDREIASLRVGSVVRSVRPMKRRVIPFRTVRAIGRCKDGTVGSVTFTIQRESWTGRCYTVYTYNDLRMLAYRPTGVVRRLTSKADRLVARLIAEQEGSNVTAHNINRGRIREVRGIW